MPAVKSQVRAFLVPIPGNAALPSLRPCSGHILKPSVLLSGRPDDSFHEEARSWRSSGLQVAQLGSSWDTPHALPAQCLHVSDSLHCFSDFPPRTFPLKVLVQLRDPHGLFKPKPRAPVRLQTLQDRAGNPHDG